MRLRHDVWPAGSCHFAFALQAPAGRGPHELRMELLDGAPPIAASFLCPDEPETVWAFALSRVRGALGARSSIR